MKSSTRRNGHHALRTALIAVILGLLGFRLYLPTLVKNYLNRTLNKIPEYRGHVDDVRLHLWRGAYSISGLELDKINGRIPVPFFSVRKIDFSIAWKPLFRGNLSGKVELDEPRLTFVGSKTKENSQMSIDRSWQQHFQEMLPLRMARLGIKNGEIHFRNYEATPPVDIFIRHIHAVAANLTNSLRLSQTLKATLDVQAVAMSSGAVTAHMDMDPLDPKPTFSMAFKVENLRLPELNAFFRQYLAVEAKTGTLDFYMEGTAKEGAFKGYAKPLLEHLDLLKIKEGAGVGDLAKGLAVKFVSYVLKNHAKDRLGTRIEIAGTVDKPDPNIWTAVSSFLHNWIIQALKRGFEGAPH